MQFKAKDIANLVGGTVLGNPEKTISKFSKIEEADANSITFYANPLYASFIKDTQAGILLVALDFDLEYPENTTLIQVKNPYESLSLILQQYEKTQVNTGIEEQAIVSKTATLGKGVYVGSFSYISEGVSIEDGVQIMPQVYIGKNVKIGANTRIFPGAKVFDDCIIGKNCTIHSGAIIGGDGFGFAKDDTGKFQKIPQIGNVILEDNVDIGSNTTIDRATMGSTLIKEGAKLDNLIQIGHNVVVGKNTAIAAMAGVAGSAKIGDNVLIGGLTGIKGHITVGNNVIINATSGVWSNVKDGEFLTGNPAYDFKKMLRVYQLIKRLPELLDRIVKLEKKNHE